MNRNWLQNILYFLHWQLYPVALALPAHLAFVLRGLGATNCGLLPRTRLAWHSILIHLRLECAHLPKELLHIIEDIVELPPEVPGVIVECGVFHGGSSAKISHAVELVGRKLIICDSFEGLPQVGPQNNGAAKPDFKQGEYRGQLEEVRGNLAKHGRPDCVEYVVGWFDKSLVKLADVNIACAFWDVDIQESFRTCLTYLWNQTNPGSNVFIHDVDRGPVVDVFTDTKWWKENLGEEPPELVGAYTGLSRGSPMLGLVKKE